MDQKTKLNGQAVRALMDVKCMDILRLAWLMGCHSSVLKNALDGDPVTIEFAVRMANTLNVPIVEITMAP